MMDERTVDDRLRQEYFELLPEIRRVEAYLETEVRHCLLPVSLDLSKYEYLIVESRVKECESAIGALRRRQEGATFDPDQRGIYTLTSLNDLAGVRVLAFPPNRVLAANEKLRNKFPNWKSDPVPSYDKDEPDLAFKHHGYCWENGRVRGEIQIVSMLIGLFWKVEHSAIYKPMPELKGAVGNQAIRQSRSEVVKALRAFEQEFEKLTRENLLHGGPSQQTQPPTATQN